MKVAIHIKNNTPQHIEGCQALVAELRRVGIEVVERWTPGQAIDMMVSIGGDGTLLSAVHQLEDSGIPVVGINFGHLGFLTTAGRDDIRKLASCLKEGRYTIEPRTMLQVTLDVQGEPDQQRQLYALNEVYLHRCELQPLLHTQVYMDDDMVATYAADGLIVATPTGSTAYSLSCGGPILTPGSGSLVITPIAAHTLTQRPIILSDDVCLRLRDEDAEVKYTLGVDSFVCTMLGGSVIEIRKASFHTHLVRIEHQNFFSALRDKLMWGV